MGGDTGVLDTVAYNRSLVYLSEGCIFLPGIKSNRSRICFVLSALLTFMGREVNYSCGVKKLQLWDIIVSDRQIADGAILLASPACDL